jgi:hypothetical protein
MLDEVARWDDLVASLRPMTYGARGEPARCLVSVGPTTTVKASSEGWRLRLRPNNTNLELRTPKVNCAKAKALVSGRDKHTIFFWIFVGYMMNKTNQKVRLHLTCNLNIDTT